MAWRCGGDGVKGPSGRIPASQGKGGWLEGLEEEAERRFVPIAFVLFFLFFGLHLFYVYFCPYNGDEGKYLYAGRLVVEGKLLYRDSFFHHFPLMPYVYGVILRLFADGIYGARVISVTFSLAAFLLMLAVAKRVSGPLGALAYAFFLSFNFYGIAQLTRAKTYPLPAFLIAAALFTLFCWKGPKLLRYGVAMGLGALAAAARLSMLPFLVVTFLSLLIMEWEDPRLRRQLPFLFALSLLLLFSYAFLVPAKLFFYDTLLWNISHVKKVGLLGYMGWQLDALKGVALRLMPMTLIFVIFLFEVLRSTFDVHASQSGAVHGERQTWNDLLDWLRQKVALGGPLTFVALTTGALFIAQFFLGYIYEEYQAPLIPALALLAGDGLQGLYRRWLQQGRTGMIVVLMAAVLGTALYSGVRYGFLKKESFAPEPALERFYEQAETIARNTSPEGPNILTFDAVPAYLAHRTVAPGLEYQWWGFWPEAGDEEALRYRTMNAGMARRLILSGHSQAIQEGFLKHFVDRYDPDGAVKAFVQANYRPEAGYYFLQAATEGRPSMGTLKGF